VELRRRITLTYVLIGGWIVLFFSLLRIPQLPSPPIAHTIPQDPQLFLALTTILVVAVFVGVFLVVSWLSFVLRVQRRGPLRWLQ
jgi:hypothetical protein